VSGSSVMLQCMSLVLAPFDVRRDAAIRTLLGVKRKSLAHAPHDADDPQQTSRHALRKGLADNQSQYFARLRGLSLIHAHGVVDAERAGAIGRNVKKASRRHHVLKDLGDIAGIS